MYDTSNLPQNVMTATHLPILMGLANAINDAKMAWSRTTVDRIIEVVADDLGSTDGMVCEVFRKSLTGDSLRFTSKVEPLAVNNGQAWTAFLVGMAVARSLACQDATGVKEANESVTV